MALSGAIEAWHVFTGIGSTLGFVSTTFLIYDRVLRYRPIVSVSARRGLGGTSPSHATPILHIKNIAPFHSLIERFTVSPPLCSIAPNSEIRGMANVLAGADKPILLSPAEDRELVIILRGRAAAQADQKIVVAIHWRRGLATWGPLLPTSSRGKKQL